MASAVLFSFCGYLLQTGVIKRCKQNKTRKIMMTYTYTTGMAFTHNGWYCTIKEALGGYKVKAVAMTPAFLASYNRYSFTEADEYRGCGAYREFRVPQLFIGWGRAIEKAKRIISCEIGAAPMC